MASFVTIFGQRKFLSSKNNLSRTKVLLPLWKKFNNYSRIYCSCRVRSRRMQVGFESIWRDFDKCWVLVASPVIARWGVKAGSVDLDTLHEKDLLWDQGRH